VDVPVLARARIRIFYAVRLVVVIIIMSRGARALLRRPRGFLTRLRFNGIRKKTCDDNINKERVYMRGVCIYITLYRKTVKRFFCFELNFFRFFVCSRNGRRSCITPYGRVFLSRTCSHHALLGALAASVGARLRLR
jgi:hypothetical protein